MTQASQCCTVKKNPKSALPLTGYMPKQTIRTQDSDRGTAECDPSFATGLLDNLLLHAFVLP